MDFIRKFDLFLNEKTFNIGKDVDFIYNKGFKPYLDILFNIKNPNAKIDFFKAIDKNNPNDRELLLATIDSSKLSTKKCKAAHEVNPITIKAGIKDYGSFYNPQKKLIWVSMNWHVVDMYRAYGIRAWERVRDGRERFRNELKVSAIKGTIYHELSHWLSDSLYNQHIAKRLEIAQKTQDASIVSRFGSALFTDFEIDAQVHAIKQIKRDYRKTFDSLTWMDIIKIKGTFHVIFKKLNTLKPEEQQIYFKLMSKRLARESLLSKGMTNSFFSAVKGAR